MSGMYRINKKDMNPQYFSPQTEGYSHIRPDKYIRSIYRDEEGIVWAGGYYNFKGIHPVTGKMEHYTTEYPITYITSKSKDELWIGTINGLYLFNKPKRKCRRYSCPLIWEPSTPFIKTATIPLISVHTEVESGHIRTKPGN